MDSVSIDLNGIIGVINTPFTENDKIDSDSLRRYVNHSIDCGVVGFLACGLAAEITKLSFEERKEIFETVVDEVNGRVPVIGGTTSSSDHDLLPNSKLAIKTGCDGVLINLPFTDKDKFKDEVRKVASLNPGFLMIQDWDFDGYGIPVDVIVELFEEIGLFKYFKIEVKPAGVKYSEVITATGGRLHVSGGWAGTQMIEALDRGVNAFMPTILHDIYVMIYKYHREGSRESAVSLFNRLLPIIAFSHQHADICVHFNKRLVHSQDIFTTAKVREPILKFDEYHEKIAAELILYARNLSQSLPIH